jgi:2-polyprenyl-6-methoxyphenol hydroxylase-like FAD-dependent oxidoreductase
MEATGGVTAWFEDGRELHADFLIGADGLHSTVRQRLHGAVKPRYAGYTCWRGVANLQPETMRNAGFEAWGPGARFAVYPCGPRRVFWYATRNMKEGEADSLRGRKADVQEMFGRWHLPIPDVIEATQGTDIVRNDIVDRPPSRLWGKGRMTLLGDAAHPTTPNLGQGACQAIEDAIVLADQLRRAGNTEGALRAYEKLRQRRTARITTESFRLGRVCQWENSVACWLRNTGTRFFPQSASLRLMERFFKTALPEL